MLRLNVVTEWMRPAEYAAGWVTGRAGGRLCLTGRVRLLGAAGRRQQGSEGYRAASLLLAAGLKCVGQGGGLGVVIGRAGGGAVSRAVGGAMQKLTFRPLPIKPHEFFIGKG